MNPLAFLFIVLGVLIIIIGVKGTYKNLGTAIKGL